jgi:hypothetical protein
MGEEKNTGNNLLARENWENLKEAKKNKEKY